MINLFLGSSGSGKSYELTVYHILTALQAGRRVITNLPLNIDYFGRIDASFIPLIVLRTRSQPVMGVWNAGTEEKAFQLWSEDKWKPTPVTKPPFSHVWDFYDDWRHPVTGTGALFIVDEAQYSIPVGKTDTQVEEWTALHRHWFNDVYFATQSFGKISKIIRENTQMVYRFRNKIAWGQPDKYIRKVQDGLRGEVLNETQRHYEKKYFKLYRSHTQADGHGSQSVASDVKPWWMHWSFLGAGLCFSIFFIMFVTGNVHNPLKPNIKQVKHESKPQKPKYVVTQEAIERARQNELNSTSQANNVHTDNQKTDKTKQTDKDEPLLNKELHIVAHLKSQTKELYVFSVSQNGQAVFQISDKDLEKSGYKFQGQSDCIGILTFKQVTRAISCDAPQVGVSTL